ncbi:MAG: hypothetical protein J6T96_07420 [Bacteroidales bacterium]|nr:hypothetical protein [Bacteroidales bacterium]
MEGQGTFVNSGNDSEFVVTVRGRHYRWLWLLLLLLLPLLLLLRFEKDVAFETLDSQTEKAVGNVNLDFYYVDYALIKTNPFRFFSKDTIKLNGTSEQNGKLKFTNVSYTLFSVVFHSGALATVKASANCAASDTLHPKFAHLQDMLPFHVGIGFDRADLVFKVLDKEDKQPLVDADVEVIVDGETKHLTTDPSGFVSLDGVIRCGDVAVNAQKEGYLGDTIKADVATILQGEHNSTLLLKPGKGIVSFTVLDLENDQPIPNATAKLIINGESVSVTTNTDGVGKGYFENVSAKEQFELGFSRQYYHDTISKKYKVPEFEKLKDKDKVFKMRPEKNNLVFRNVDSLTSQVIAGVANHVFVNGNDMGTLYSNRQGCFTIGNIGANDEIKIEASHAQYKPKSAKISGTDALSNNQHKRDVAMEPKKIIINLPPPVRNCGVHFSGTLLSDTKVQGHISKIYEPDIYGEYVGDGRYANNQAAFPKAVKYTFDAIAVDKGTHLKVYSKPNFQGEVLLDVSGPYLINNVKWKNEARIKDFITKTFSPEFEANYPKSCRHWSESNMNAWDFGSVVITCDK